MERLTKRSTLNKAVSLLPDKSFDFMIRMSPGIMGKIVGMLSFEKLADMAKVWNGDMIADGMNFVVGMANRTKVFYPIYQGEELCSDKGKRMTGMACFIQEKRAKFVMVCAGGGYGAVATMQEAFPVAKALYGIGYHVFVLQYRCGKNAFAPNPMDDLAQAVRIVIANKDKWKIDISDYAVVGFSAGGHLASCFGTKRLGYERYTLPKPGAMILGYPVITMGKYAHKGSRDNLLGKQGQYDMVVQRKYSVECNITHEYPKTFVWQCDLDNTVPVENTKLFVRALKENHVQHLYETFPSDAHGWGLGLGTDSEGWLERAVEFWRSGNC